MSLFQFQAAVEGYTRANSPQESKFEPMDDEEFERAARLAGA